MEAYNISNDIWFVDCKARCGLLVTWSIETAVERDTASSLTAVHNKMTDVSAV